MALTRTPPPEFGARPPDFRLLGVDGRPWSLGDCVGPKGLLVMFISNHCPYVKAVRKKIVRDTDELRDLGVLSVAIQPNDTDAYPEDDMDNMKRVARECGFNFPYLLDETQEIARAYGAVCTPDFFGYNSDLELQFRGRIDAAGASEGTGDERRELFEAMKQIAETGKGPEDQVPSMGCSIKWRE